MHVFVLDAEGASSRVSVLVFGANGEERGEAVRVSNRL